MLLVIFYHKNQPVHLYASVPTKNFWMFHKSSLDPTKDIVLPYDV